MKIEEARSLYRGQIKSYHEQQNKLAEQKKQLEQKIRTTPDGVTVYANEAATLELTTQAVNEKQDEYKAYMEKLMEQWSGICNMEAAKQQGEAMKEYAEDMGKILEVARRLMDGDIVPATDEKKLMDFSMEMYQAAKNIGMMAKKKEQEEHKSLWEDEEETENADPAETADQSEVAAAGPEVVPVEQTMAVAGLTGTVNAGTEI